MVRASYVFGTRETQESDVLVQADYQDSGTEISAADTTIDAKLQNLSTRYAIEYRVGTGDWRRLEPNTSTSIDIDLATTSIFVRRVRYSTTPIYVRVTSASDESVLNMDTGETLSIVDGVLHVNGSPTGVGESVTVGVATSRALTSDDNGKTLEVTAGAVTLTVPAGLGASFGCAVIPNGTTSVASSGGALLNGATTTLTRAAVDNAIFAIIARATVADSYVVTGA